MLICAYESSDLVCHKDRFDSLPSRQGRLVKTCLLEAHNRRQFHRWWRVRAPQWNTQKHVFTTEVVKVILQVAFMMSHPQDSQDSQDVFFGRPDFGVFLSCLAMSWWGPQPPLCQWEVAAMAGTAFTSIHPQKWMIRTRPHLDHYHHTHKKKTSVIFCDPKMRIFGFACARWSQSQAPLAEPTPPEPVTPDQVYHVFAGEPTGNRVGEKRAAFFWRKKWMYTVNPWMNNEKTWRNLERSF